ncbi:c-type cytochrome [Polymorphospora rubra]|uniref:Cystathionine beta-lyase n=1 Tax=Polymorphospora rubra TaxID=338584 RepID=A0A810N4C6_9ACTN|nr:c-type cytochrome [Polymorphospora rubra]BCJ68571.1 cystathionine beta-lyase [Polymorphospora rubra]
MDTPQRGNRRRALAVAAVALLALGPAAVTPATRAPAAVTPGARAPAPTAAPAPDGADLYLRTCASCHGDQGRGTQRGPSLVGVGPASVDFQLGTGRMPLTHEERQPTRHEPVFSAAEIAALVDHVATFGGGGPPIPDPAPGDVAAGRQIFAANCAPCHSATGSGTDLTNGLVAPPLYEATAVQIAEAVRVGPGPMPAFPGEVLTDRQVDDLTSYVRLLSSERLDAGGNPLGRLGPSTEGLVAWLFGLSLLVLAARWLGTRADR